MATANDIVKRALRLLNVLASGETPEGAEGADALATLNNLIDSWSNERLMLHQIVQVTHTLTASDGTYSIGSGGDINTTRPVRIEFALTRDSNNIDVPMEIVSDMEWQRIGYKTITSPYPKYLYYRESHPTGQINLWPVPSAAYTLVMSVWQQLSSFSALSTTVAFPPGYQRCLEYNLAVELAPEYKEPSPLVLQQARESKKWLKVVNSNEYPVMVPETKFLGGNNSRFFIEDGLFR